MFEYVNKRKHGPHDIEYASSPDLLTCSTCNSQIQPGETYLKVQDHPVEKGFVRLKIRSYCFTCSRSWFGDVEK